jgi:hypothetical protein
MTRKKRGNQEAYVENKAYQFPFDIPYFRACIRGFYHTDKIRLNPTQVKQTLKEVIRAILSIVR